MGNRASTRRCTVAAIVSLGCITPAGNDLPARGADFAPQNRIICIGADVSGNSPGSPRASS
jgi:hypothetical protein